MTDQARQPTIGFDDEGEETFWTAGEGELPAVDCVPVIMRAMGWLIRVARLNQGLRLADVSDRVGVSVSVLSRAERLAREHLRVDLVLAVCNALGVRFSDIMRLAEDEAFPVDERPWTDHPHTLISLAGYEWVPQIGGETFPD
jgi:transcriptional regulator with XRE-family HTH domain